MVSSIWNKDIPVEKSSYLCDEITYFNLNKFKHDENKLTMIDLFCGAGGFAVGCSWAGFESVLGIDHFEPAIRTWSYNHPNAIGCLGDITKIDPKKIKELLHSKGIDKIHLITGGVPCQGFSIANRKHNDNDERNYLFLEYMKFVKEFDPDYIILENVSGMRSTAGGQFEKKIKEIMSLLGYTTTVDLLNAADYGVPQIRQRLIFVGVKQERGLVSEYVFPVGDFKNNYRTVHEAISDLPELGNNEEICKYTKPANSEYQKLMKGNGKIASIPSPNKLTNHISPNYLSKYETGGYVLGELLKSRETTALYQVDAGFRGDPYPGCLAAVDYLSCRQGLTFEDRRNNLVMVWGRIEVDEINRTLIIHNDHGSTIEDFFNDVKNSSRNNLLVKDYVDLDNKEIPRYFMQVRYGSTYSKVKHIRVYSYFADAILFPDGSLWRDA